MGLAQKVDRLPVALEQFVPRCVFFSTPVLVLAFRALTNDGETFLHGCSPASGRLFRHPSRVDPGRLGDPFSDPGPARYSPSQTRTSVRCSPASPWPASQTSTKKLADNHSPVRQTFSKTFALSDLFDLESGTDRSVSSTTLAPQMEDT